VFTYADVSFLNYYYCPAVTSFIIFTAVSGYLKKSLLPFLWYLTGITVQSSFTYIWQMFLSKAVLSSFQVIHLISSWIPWESNPWWSLGIALAILYCLSYRNVIA